MANSGGLPDLELVETSVATDEKDYQSTSNGLETQENSLNDEINGSFDYEQSDDSGTNGFAGEVVKTQFRKEEIIVNSYLEQKVESLNEEVKRKQTVIKKLKQSLDKKSEEIEELKKLSSKISILTKERDTLEKKCRKRTKDLAKSQLNNQEQQSQIFTMNLEMTHLKQDLEKIKKVLGEELKCPVCLSVPRTDRIPVCSNGHITCDTCKQRKCPLCSVSMANPGINIIAQNIAEVVEFNCINKDKGCTVNLARKQIIEHEQSTCVYAANLKCPGVCTAMLSVKTLDKHIDICLGIQRVLEKLTYENAVSINIKHSSVLNLTAGIQPPFKTIGTSAWEVPTKSVKMLSVKDNKTKFFIVRDCSGQGIAPQTRFFVLHWHTYSGETDSAGAGKNTVFPNSTKQGHSAATRQPAFYIRLTVSNPSLSLSRSFEGKSMAITKGFDMKAAIESGNVLEISESVMKKITTEDNYEVTLVVKDKP